MKIVRSKQLSTYTLYYSSTDTTTNSSFPYTNFISFFVLSISSNTFLEYPSMNLILKFANPKKLYTVLTLCSIGYSRIALIFLGLIYTP